MQIDLSQYKNKIVQHFKGDYYMIVDVAEHTETGEQLVIYRALYGDCKLYARPATMFVQLVDKEKYPNSPFMYRFTPARIKGRKELQQEQMLLQLQKQMEEQQKTQNEENTLSENVENSEINSVMENVANDDDVNIDVKL